ncbi:MAG: hypothetical protein LBV40_03260 [Methanomicrobiales archaeon]|jgi:hypothetical protein|nr:hypothetical protein [Methanomicrobiales archaeon]
MVFSRFFSFGLFAALLVVVAVELLRRGWSESGRKSISLLFCMGSVALVFDMTLAFVFGCALVLGESYLRKYFAS